MFVAMYTCVYSFLKKKTKIHFYTGCEKRVYLFYALRKPNYWLR